MFNFGLPGDRVQNTLWRLDEIPTSHLRPRHVALILGTNNLADGDAPGAIAAGLATVMEKVARLWGEPLVILPAIARRRAGPLARDAQREELNRLLFAMEGPRIRHVRSDLVLDALGADAFEPDGIHISRLGYARLTDALVSYLDG